MMTSQEIAVACLIKAKQECPDLNPIIAESPELGTVIRFHLSMASVDLRVSEDLLLISMPVYIARWLNEPQPG